MVEIPFMIIDKKYKRKENEMRKKSNVICPIRENNGITLVALSIYIVAMVIIVALISLLTTYFYGNVVNMSDTTKDITQFDQFNAYMIEETKKIGNRIASLNEEEKVLTFTSGNVYKMEESGIYCNNIRIYQANLDMANSYFFIKQENGKDIVVVSVLTDTSYTRTEEYVMGQTDEEIYETYDNYYNSQTYQKREDGAVIPDGFVASSVPGEETAENGLVIYEGTEAVTEENHEEAMKTRNQYVWIPVKDINSMVMCKSNSEDSVCQLTLEGGILKCKVHESTATDLVGRLYTGNGYRPSDIMDFTQKNQRYSATYREPELLDTDKYNDEFQGGNWKIITIEQLKSDFTEMATSVAKNGGFYIGRYEIGGNGESKKGQKILTGGLFGGENYYGGFSWYGLYMACRNDRLKTRMIWGCQYDQVIKFIGEKAQVEHEDWNLTTSPALSGQNESDKMKNIYDLEGNFSEYTLEADITYDNRIIRGGSYEGKRTASSRIRRDISPSSCYEEYSSRTTFYL